MKILFVGSIHEGSEPVQQINALTDLGHKVDSVSDTPFNFAPGINYEPSFMDRVRHKLLIPLDKTKINSRLIDKVKGFKPDIIWVAKSMVLKPKTIKTIKKLFPEIKWIWFSGDDMYARHNQSRWFLQCLPLYDVVFTTKSYNCNEDELPSLGAKKVVFIPKSFDPNMHFPVDIVDEDCKKLGAEVGFIGTFELDRAQKMLHLAKCGYKVRVWGNGWDSWINEHPNLIIENKPLYNEDFRKSVCATKINLCFLRKLNRDLHTNRSIEIPAFAGFMLAERSSEHEELFVDGDEAVFFDINNLDELANKVDYYLKHDEERNKIASNGRERCLNSDYSMQARVKEMLDNIV